MSKVLLVDDDIAEISSVKRALLRAGHQPTLATNASDATTALDRDPPDLLIVSATCENGDALALAQRLPHDAATARIPVLVLGDGDGEPVPPGARRLARPLDPEQLLAEVSAALGPPAGIALEPPDDRPAPAPPRPIEARATPPASDRRAPAAQPRPGVPAGTAHPSRAVPPLVQAAEAAAAKARAGANAAAAPREAPAGAASLAAPLPGPAAPAAAPTVGDAASSRRAAADALRARAEELRKSRQGSAASPNAAPAPAPAAPAAPRPAPARAAAAKPAGPTAPILLDPPAAPQPRAARPSLAEALELDEGEMEAALRRADAAKARDGVSASDAVEDARRQAAEDALRALEEEASSHAAEVARTRRAERAAPEEIAPARPAADERALQEAIEAARREAFEAAKRELGEQARQEAAEAARLVQAEARARQEAVANAEREALELARARSEAEQRARAEAEARRSAEEQLQALRELLEEEKRKAEERVATVMQRAAQEEEAADELRRMAEDELRRRDEESARTHAAEEEKLREAIASARTEMESLRRKGEEEARRRAEAESALQRLEEAQRQAAERDAEEREIAAREATQREAAQREAAQREAAQREAAQRDAAERDAAERDAAERDAEEREIAAREAAERAELAQRQAVERARRPRAAPRRAEPRAHPRAEEAERFTPPPFFAPFEDAAEDDAPKPAPAEEAARRRVAALRAAAEAEPAEPPFLMSSPEPIPEPVEAPPAPEPGRAFPAPPPPLRSGELAEIPVPRLLAMAAKAKLGGRLDFQGHVARSVWFEDGRVSGAASADPSDRVEEVALRLGLITREQHRQIAQATASLPSRRAALLLLERGFLKPTELTGLVRRRTEEVLFGVFGEESGRFRWTGTEVPPEERTALERGALALAVEGVRRRWRGARVDALLGGPATLLSPVPGAPGPAELGLSAEERRAVALADGLRTLDEIVQASPLDALTTRQVLAALVATGALSVRVLHAGQPRGQASASIDLARVKDKLEQVRRADYFTVLGVGRLCTPHEVREAADRLTAEFEPRRFSGVADEGLPGRLAEILQVVQDAREVLADDRLREEYLRGLGDGG